MTVPVTFLFAGIVEAAPAGLSCATAELAFDSCIFCADEEVVCAED